MKMFNRKMACSFTSILMLFLLTSTQAQRRFEVNIARAGAVADGETDNAALLQSLIDQVSKRGGGRIIFPPGNFMTSPIEMKSGVELHLQKGSRLLGSTLTATYKRFEGRTALIYAKGQRDISISGDGIIDGQGQEYMLDLFRRLRSGEEKQDSAWLYKRPGGRSLNIWFFNCRNVRVTGVTIKNSSDWVQDYRECDSVVIDRIKVQSTAYWNNDGLDVTDSRNVRITNCFINATDDGICLKSENPKSICENIYIDSNIVRSSASGFKLGTAGHGGFRNITVRNLTVFDTYRSAIALESVDGGVLEDIDIRGVRAYNTGNAIFLRRGHRNVGGPVGTLKRVHISDVVAEIPLLKPDQGYPIEGPPDHLNPGFDRMPIRPSHFHLYGHPFLPYNLIPSSIVGLPGFPVEDVVIENVEINYGGGGHRSVAHIPLEDLGRVPENRANYPEFSMFGELPAWGFYLRHARGIQFRNVKLSFKKDDYRPAVTMDDVQSSSFSALKIPTARELPVVFLHETKEISFTGLETVFPLTEAVKRVNNAIR
ncbi:MAG: glycoside hydrolase family 28 protein [Chitinophagaceae bacterium]